MKEPIAEPAETLNQECLAMVYTLLKFRFVLIVISLRNNLQRGLITLLIKNGQPSCMHYYSIFALFCDPCINRDNRFHDEGCQNGDDIVILHSVLSSLYFVILALSETLDERCLHAHSTKLWLYFVILAADHKSMLCFVLIETIDSSS